LTLPFPDKMTGKASAMKPANRDVTILFGQQ
jgi:hypothetical protein